MDRGAIWITGSNCPSIIADAGSDLVLCNGIAQTSLNARDAGAGIGEWSLLTGSGVLQNINDPNTSVADLSTGNNLFIWTVTSQPGCVYKDTVDVIVYPSPSQPFAGDDQTLCGQIQTYLNATPVNSGFGRWLSGGGSIEILNPNSPTTIAKGLSPGTNLFIWETYSSGQCEPLRDTIEVMVFSPPSVAFAGEEINLCGERTTTLNALEPEVGKGKWEIVSGNVVLGSAYDPKTEIEILTEGRITLKWTTETKFCPPSDDLLIINLYAFDEEDVYNVITPDGNGKNDFWIIKNLNQLPGTKNLKIVNRWGEIVFETADYQNNWDALELGNGIYFYHLNLATCRKDVKGWITVIK